MGKVLTLFSWVLGQQGGGQGEFEDVKDCKDGGQEHREEWCGGKGNELCFQLLPPLAQQDTIMDQTVEEEKILCRKWITCKEDRGINHIWEL